MTTYERIEKVIKHIERHRREQPRLSELAGVAGLSEFHFHRLFSRWAGATLKDFLKYLTNEHAKSLLRSSGDLLGVSLDAGLSGPGRLHDLLVSVEGVTPGEYKSGGDGVTIRHGDQPTPFGAALIGLAPRGICHLSFFDSPRGRSEALRDLRSRWPHAILIEDRKEAARTIDRIFDGGKFSALLSGTPFQLKVWEALLRIPEGRAATYGQLADAVGAPGASRAVGSAVGRNPIAYLIPCHRVIKSAGLVGGYRWGPARKRAILAWEGARAER